MLSPESKNAWNDKFSLPTLEELKSLQPKPLQSVFGKCRQRLLDLDLTEAVQWQGVPWRWTIVFRRGAPKFAAEPVPQFQPSADGSSSDLRGFAYLIPDPSRLQICVPLHSQQIELLPMKRMKKPIRDGVALARSVGGLWWPTWELGSLAAVDEVFELVKRKHDLLSKGTQPVTA